jgi:hypothetical protein
MMVAEMFLRGRCLLTWTDRDVTWADGRTGAFTPKPWEELFLPRDGDD